MIPMSFGFGGDAMPLGPMSSIKGYSGVHRPRKLCPPARPKNPVGLWDEEAEAL